MGRAGSLRMLVMVVGMVSFNAGTVFGQLAPRTPLPKRPYQLMPDRPHRMVVKFVDVMQARCNQQGQLTAQHQGMLNQVQTVVQTHNLLFTRLIQIPYAQLTNLEQRAAARSNKAQPDLGGMMVVHFPQSANELQVANDLKNLSAVEFLINEPLDASFPEDYAPTTPLLVGDQDYPCADPGIDMEYAWSREAMGSEFNSRGKGIRVTDVEGDWNLLHEDLVDVPVNVLVEPHPDALGIEHGTSSLGVLAAKENSYGITGLTPEADFQVSTVFIDTGYPDSDEETGVANAIAASGPGDVVMIEREVTVSLETQEDDAVMLEILEPIWVLTLLATHTDIVIVAAAGNGSIDLDANDHILISYRERKDSGAILVGAGTADTSHQRLDLSNYGDRVDVQAWGEDVLTTQCRGLVGAEGCLIFGDDHDQSYDYFTGTSSASPIVVGAVASLQGFHKDRFGTFFDLTSPVAEPDDDPNSLRRLLVQTGICQGGEDNCVAETFEDIGPIPDLRAAIDTLLNDASVALPFDDPFPSTTVDDAKWPITTGVIDTLGDGEPSAPNSMHLGPGQSFETASMVTTEACTAGLVIQATLEFSWQSGGTVMVPNGNLAIEYRTDSETWQALPEIQPGAPQPFQEVNVPLTSTNGLHDSFRLRFTSEATVGDWFVDDVHFDIVTIPDFVLTPFTQTVCEGDPVSFEIEVVGGGTLTYQWEKDGTPITGATATSYSITAADPGDTGDYTVVATNACDSTESTPGELTVEVPTALGTITANPPTQPVDCGTAVTLSITATGTPAPALQWHLDGNPILGATSATYVISAVTLADEGDYTVVASNAVSCIDLPGDETVTSNPFTLDVDQTSDCTSGQPVMVSARSQLSHGAVEYAINLTLEHGAGAPTSEPRTPGVRKIQIVFDQPMDEGTAENEANTVIKPCDGDAPGTAGCEGEAIAAANLLTELSADGLTLTVTFPELTNDQLPNEDRYTFDLAALKDAQLDLITGDTKFDLRAVAGDSNGDGAVDPLDSGYVQARFSASPSLETRADVNADDAIDPLDLGAVQSRFGDSAP